RDQPSVPQYGAASGEEPRFRSQAGEQWAPVGPHLLHDLESQYAGYRRLLARSACRRGGPGRAGNTGRAGRVVAEPAGRTVYGRVFLRGEPPRALFADTLGKP